MISEKDERKVGGDKVETRWGRGENEGFWKKVQKSW